MSKRLTITITADDFSKLEDGLSSAVNLLQRIGIHEASQVKKIVIGVVSQIKITIELEGKNND